MLFRREALEHQRQRLAGNVIIAQPLSMTVMIALLGLVVAVAVFALAFGSYARTETGLGFLVPEKGVVKLFPPEPGLVADVEVAEGSVVAKGAPLLTIVLEQATQGGAGAQARSLALIDRQLAALTDRATSERSRYEVEGRRLEAEIASLETEIKELRGQRAVQSEITESAARSFESLSELVDQGYVARSEYERRRQAHLEQQQLERAYDQQILALERERANVGAALERLPTEHASRLTGISDEKAGLERRRAEIERQQAYRMTAPIAGRVSALQVSDGRFAEAARPLLTILPEDGPLAAEVYVPSRAIGFVKPGQEVRLLYDAFPYQRFGSFTGTVRSVTKTILSPEEIAAPVELAEPSYRVVVDLDRRLVDAYGESVPLQPGMTLKANIILERRSLLAWILEPLKAVGNRS